jgi:hypothetical protein
MFIHPILTQKYSSESHRRELYFSRPRYTYTFPFTTTTLYYRCLIPLIKTPPNVVPALYTTPPFTIINFSLCRQNFPFIIVRHTNLAVQILVLSLVIELLKITYIPIMYTYTETNSSSISCANSLQV